MSSSVLLHLSYIEIIINILTMIYIVCFQAGHTGACDPAPVYGDLRRT